MDRIGTIDRLHAVRTDPARDRPVRPADGDARPARALVALDGGRGAAVNRPRDGRPEAGFVAQLLACTDPTLRPSRLDRTRAAAALYAETARRLA